MWLELSTLLVLTFESKITSIYKAYIPDPNFLYKL
jgi:hypothetical protein